MSTPTTDELLASLDLAEKAQLCAGGDFWHTAAVPRLGIEPVMVADGPHGLRVQHDSDDHGGIAGAVPATCFPTAAGLASSWDPDLVAEVGAAIGLEARAQGVSVVLGPGVNIKRSPLCGRNFEYFSEDPALAGALGAAMVHGIQSTGVGACVKHFAANNQETDRLRVSADVDERTLREIYLPAFEHVVTQARPWMVMCAYNRVNGVPASEHRWLLTELLRGEWGFDGVVVSDWGAVGDRVAALAAGLDLQMPPDPGVGDAAVVDAVHAGGLRPEVLDTAVGRVLGLVDRAGRSVPGEPVDHDAHHRLARRAAARSAVLLANDGLLPLDPRAGDTIGVVGAFARTPRFQGAGSSQVTPTRVENLVDELRSALPRGVELRYADGFSLDPDVDPVLARSLAQEAVAIAGAASVVVVCLGLPPDAESEGFDRTHIDLPADQTDLLARIAAVTDRVVVVLANGAVVQVDGWQDHAGAVLECWLGGQASGGAVADLLLGTVAPSGRLAETIPVQLGDLPAQLDFPGGEGHVRYGEGVFVGYRGLDAQRRAVSYPFGHGLTYTSFVYHDLQVHHQGSVDGGDLTVQVQVTVTNTGSRAGRDVVQLYVAAPPSPVARPAVELKAFASVEMAAGDERHVTMRLTQRDLAYWSTTHQRWLVQPGDHTIAVGASARDLRLRVVLDVAATQPGPPLDGTATLQEWLADARGAHSLARAMGADDGLPPPGILGDPATQAVIGNFPLNRLTTFPSTGLTRAVIAHATELLG